jgi:hypothetical protein
VSADLMVAAMLVKAEKAECGPKGLESGHTEQDQAAGYAGPTQQKPDPRKPKQDEHQCPTPQA